MNTHSLCPRCGTRLPTESLGGLCPRCVGARLFADRGNEEPSPSGSELADESIGLMLGRYKLEQKLGEGGCGVVYAAEQEVPLRRRVAVKVIKLGMDTKAVVTRFEAERQALAMMDHPNIAKVFDAGATRAGRPYFVMELVPGARLTEYCDQRQLSTKDRIQLFLTVCQAIQHAHQKGVIHRDLKPSNILVIEVDGAATPKVIDFGIAKAAGHQLTEATLVTEAHQFLGTPAYMSPEQAQSGATDIDTRSDIYSLGVILYELLTGRTPFDMEQLRSAGPDEMRRIIREVEPPRPSTRHAPARNQDGPPPRMGRIRGDLDWIVMKCLEKDRTRRYESANALADDLRRHLADEPVVAGPPTAAYRFGKFARRNKTALAAAVMFAMLLLSATAISVRLAVRAFRAETEARKNLATSEEARQESDAIAKFLGEILQSPDPAQSGRNVTVAETLARSAQKVETDFARHPERRARLQATLGGTYRALGLFREAIPLEEKVLEHRRTTAGPDHADTLEAMHQLALSYDEADRPMDAFRLRETLLESHRRLVGREHPRSILAMIYLGESFTKTGRRARAAQLQEEALALSRRINGAEHRDTVLAMCYLAWTYCTLEKFEKSLEIGTNALPKVLALGGPEHPGALNVMTVLALSQTGLGRIDEGLPLQRQVVALSQKIKGPHHPETVWAMGNLADTLSSAGLKEESVRAYEALVAASVKANGPEHLKTRRSIHQLLDEYLDEQRYTEAEPLLQRELQRERQRASGEPPLWLKVAHAEFVCRQGRHAEAESMYRDLVLNLKPTGQERGVPELIAKSGLAGVLIERAWAARSGPSLDALRLAREAETLSREVLGASSNFAKLARRQSLTFRSRLAAAMHLSASLDSSLSRPARESKLAEAETLLLQVHERLEADRSAATVFVRHNRLRLARLYESWGRHDSEAKWRKALDEMKSVQPVAAQRD